LIKEIGIGVPINKGTEKQFECQSSITPQMIIEIIDSFKKHYGAFFMINNQIQYTFYLQQETAISQH
jgi:hypothetical protein